MVQEKDLVHTVRRLIANSLGTGMITTAQASEHLGLPVRSLHRHLGQSGTTFKLLREEVLLEFAEEALRETNLSISAIASRLNYSEPSAFDRMFKRLKGVTPSEYRRKYKLRERMF